jgi:polyisoprenoid-binding protein YceI
MRQLTRRPVTTSLEHHWQHASTPRLIGAKRDKEVAMGNWRLDPYHTQVEFSAKHFQMMTVRGHFAEVSTTADIFPEHPETSSVQVTIQAASIRTHNETRDDDLRSPNFLEVEKYPVITFKSTGVQQTGPDRYRLTGDLTVKSITQPVTLEVTKYGELNDPGMMGHRISYGARGHINRTDFGVGTEWCWTASS